MASMPEVEIFPTGVQRQSRPGGWGAILRSRGVEKELAGAEPATTNNRMELMAAIAGLEALKRPCRVRLYTDSNTARRHLPAGFPVEGAWLAHAGRHGQNIDYGSGWKPRAPHESSGTGCAVMPATRKTSAPTRWSAARSPAAAARQPR